MPRKSESRKENRGRGGHNTERQERTGKWKDAKLQDRSDQPGSPNQQPIQEQYQQPIQQETPGNVAGLDNYKKLLQGRWQQNQENRQLQGGQVKKGCLPKLFMLTLPFVFVLTFLIAGL